MSFEAGAKLGPYEIIESAGVGGMGEVFKARDTRLDRTVAIKVLPASTAMNADLKARFEREAKLISSLNHPNICILHDIGNEAGRDYLVMEFLEGETLAERLKSGPLSLEQALTIASEISDALDKAHRQGLIHRDLKPGNVMLTPTGAKLLDFGLAKAQFGSGANLNVTQITQTTPLTGAGTIMGTIQFMAPELLDGSEADIRSDIFAFGVMFYEMLTGQRAFEGKSQASLIAAIIERQPPLVSEIKPMSPPGLDRLVKKCIAKDPDSRWQSVRDLSDEIRWIAQAGSMAGVPAPLAAKRKFKFDLARLIGLVAMIGILGLSYLYYAELTKPKPILKTVILPDNGTELSDMAGGSVALSPDGAKLAYVAADTTENRNKLWVRSLNTLTSIPLKGTEGASFPFWSPDGQYLAFFADSKMKKVLATGGPVLTICDVSSGRPGAWNENGIIIYTPNFEGPLFKVNAAGGEPEQVTTLDSANNDFTHRYPCFLPDQDHFLMFNRTGSNSGGEKDAICISSLSDPTVKHLFYAQSNSFYTEGQILFMREDILMAHQFDPSSRTLIGNARPLAENITFSDSFKRGVFSVAKKDHLVYRSGEVNNGAQLMIYTDGFASIDSVGEIEPQRSFSLSHDNRFVAVEIEDQQTTGSDIWIYDLNRNIKRRFTFAKDWDQMPIFTPNDSQIVFSSDRDGIEALYVKDVYGNSQPKILVESAVNILPWAWSPDGKYLIYGAFVPGESMNLYLYSTEEKLTDSVYLATEFMEGTAAVSPDGKWIAYSSLESGEFELYISTFPKHTTKWQVSTNGGGFPQWSLDGGRMHFLDKDRMLCVVDVKVQGRTVEVGKVKQLFNIGETSPQGFGIFNDEKTIITSKKEEDFSTDQIVHIYNWVEQLKD